MTSKANFDLLAAVTVSILIAAISIAFQGFSFPYNNNAFHVPFVLDYAGSTEGPHDAFHQSLSRFASGFWVVVSWIANEQNIENIFLVFHFVIRSSFVLMFLLILRHFGAARLHACAITLLIASAPTILRASPVSGNDMLSNYLTHSEAVVPVVLASWLLAWRGQWRWASATLGVAFNINAFLAIWNACALFAGPIFRRARQPSNLIVEALTLVLIFLLCALPNLVWILNVLKEPSPHIDFREFLRNYWPGHTFVDVSTHRAIPFGAFIALGYVYLKRAQLHFEASVAEAILQTYTAIIAILIVATAMPYVTGSRTALNTYPLRIDTYAILLLVTTAAIAFTKRVAAGDKGAGDELALLLGVLLGDLLIMSLALCLRGRTEVRKSPGIYGFFTPEFTCLLLVAASLFVTEVPPGFFEFIKPADFAFASVAIVALMVAWRYKANAGTLIATATVCLIADLILLKSLPPRWVFVALILSVVLVSTQLKGARITGAIALAVIGYWLWRHAQALEMHIAAAFLLVALTTVACRLFSSEQEKSLPKLAILATGMMMCAFVGTAWTRGTLDDFTPAQRDLLRAQRWSRSNTTAGTMFVVDRRASQFGTLSRRPVWVDWKMGAAVMWMPSYYDEWRTRYLELKRCSDLSCLIDIARRNDIRWVVVQSQSLALMNVHADVCIAYRNATYAIVTFERSKCVA